MADIKADQKTETTTGQPATALWHGVQRKSIEWYPTVDEDACIGCGMCFATCGKKVYQIVDGKSKVVSPYSCMVGCQTCMNLCLSDAISFPNVDMVRDLIKEKDVLHHL